MLSMIDSKILPNTMLKNISILQIYKHNSPISMILINIIKAIYPQYEIHKKTAEI